MRKNLAVLVLGLSFTLVASAHGQSAVDTSTWKSFASRGGWSLRYPPDWSVTGCGQCTDLSDSGVFVVFGDSRNSVWVDPLMGKPKDEDADEWLNDLKASTNANHVVSQQWILLNGTRALAVKYSDGIGVESEAIYFIHGSNSFAIRINLDNKPGEKLENAPGYAVAKQVLTTFRFTD